MTLLVVAVLTGVSLLGIVNFTQELILKTYDQGGLISQQIYEQIRHALANPPGAPPSPEDPEAFSLFLRESLESNPGLNSLLESTINNSPTIVYLAVTDNQERVLAHSMESLIGSRLPAVSHFTELSSASPWNQLRTFYGPARARNYEVTLQMFDSSRRPVGTIRVVMNMALIQQELRQYLRKNLLAAAIALLIATTLAALLSQLLLLPLGFISAGIERMVQGEFGKPIRLARQDELGLVSLRLNQIGEQLEVNREEIDSLKGNISKIVRSLEEKLMFVNLQGQISVLSPSAASLLKLPVEASIGKRLNEVLPKDHPLVGLVETAFGLKKNIASVDVQFPTLGKPISVRVHMLEERNQNLGALVILRDPHSVAKLETQLEYAGKLTALSRLTSGIAHEVKNPLNAIVIHLELLKSKIVSRAPDAEKNLSVITKEIKRLDRVVRNFLDFNRPMEVNLLDTEISPIIRDVVHLASTEAARFNILVSIDDQNGLPKVRIDPDLIKQSLMNIVLNGCQAMPDGGQLRIACRASDNFLEISVQDTGIGISPDQRAKIFNLYYTTKEDGNGIGLATVFKTVQLHNGEILVDSEPGKGSTFTLRLPLA